MPTRPTQLTAEQPAPQRFISIREVANRTGLSASSVRRQELVGTFPSRVRLGTNRVAWLEAEVETCHFVMLHAESGIPVRELAEVLLVADACADELGVLRAVGLSISASEERLEFVGVGFLLG